MYSVTVERSFVAQHFLTVPNPGPEGELHSHSYTAKVQLVGDELNDHGYLVDIDDLSDRADETVSRYRDVALNKLPEFDGLNPSLEQFARLFGDRFLTNFDAPEVESATVKLREDDVAWASFETEI